MRIRLEEGFTPAVAGTVDQHVVTATQGAAAAGFPVAPDGVDPLSAAIAGKMVTWPAELETAAGLTGQKAGHLGAAASGTDTTLRSADAQNATPFQGIAAAGMPRDA